MLLHFIIVLRLILRVVVQQHRLAQPLEAELVQPAVELAIEQVAADQAGPTAGRGGQEQLFQGRADQVLPARMTVY